MGRAAVLVYIKTVAGVLGKDRIQKRGGAALDLILHIAQRVVLLVGRYLRPQLVDVLFVAYRHVCRPKRLCAGRDRDLVPVLNIGSCTLLVDVLRLNARLDNIVAAGIEGNGGVRGLRRIDQIEIVPTLAISLVIHGVIAQNRLCMGHDQRTVSAGACRVKEHTAACRIVIRGGYGIGIDGVFRRGVGGRIITGSRTVADSEGLRIRVNLLGIPSLTLCIGNRLDHNIRTDLCAVRLVEGHAHASDIDIPVCHVTDVEGVITAVWLTDFIGRRCSFRCFFRITCEAFLLLGRSGGLGYTGCYNTVPCQRIGAGSSTSAGQRIDKPVTYFGSCFRLAVVSTGSSVQTDNIDSRRDLCRIVTAHAVIDRELDRLGGNRNLEVVFAILAGIVHDIALAALKNLPAVSVIEGDMQVVPSRRILHIDILGRNIGACADRLGGIGFGRAVLIVHGGVAVLVIKVSGLIVNDTCLVTVALNGQTVIENNLAVVGAVALRDTELIDGFGTRTRTDCIGCFGAERICRRRCSTVVLASLCRIGIGVGVNRTILCTCRRHTRP